MEIFNPTSTWDYLVLIALFVFAFWLYNSHVKATEERRRREKEHHDREVRYWMKRAGEDPDLSPKERWAQEKQKEGEFRELMGCCKFCGKQLDEFDCCDCDEFERSEP